jgi:hypothetical protein
MTAFSIALLVCAFAVRRPMVERGLPYLGGISWDEPYVVNRAIDCLRQSSWNPRWQIYPGGSIHLQTLVAGATVMQLGMAQMRPRISTIKTDSDTKYLWTVSVPEIYKNGRLLHVALDAVLVALVFVTITRAFGWVAGVSAGLLMLVYPEAVVRAAVIKPDSSAMFLVFCSTVAALAMLSNHSGLACALAAGIFAGVAAGFKYNAGAIVIAPLSAVILSRGRRRHWLTESGIILVAAAGGFFVTSPHAVLDFKVLFDDLSFQVESYAHGHETSGTQIANFCHFLRDFSSRLGILATLLAGVGVVYGLWHHTKAMAVLVVGAIALLWGNAGLRTYYFHNALPVTPLVAACFGLGLQALTETSRHAGKVRFLPIMLWPGIIIVLALALKEPWKQTRSAVHASTGLIDSRAQMMDYLATQLSSKDCVAVDEHLHPFLPEQWNGPKLLVTNVFNKTPDWFRSNHVRYLVVATTYEYLRARPEDRAAADWMGRRFEDVPSLEMWGKEAFLFRAVLWDPMIALREIKDYNELPGTPIGVLPGVALTGTGRVFLTDHAWGVGQELYSRGQLSGAVEIETTASRVRLTAGGFWRHPDFPHVKITATPVRPKGPAVVVADNYRIEGYEAYPVSSIPCNLGPGLWQITIDFLNGDDPLPLFEEKDARRLGIRLLEFLP